MEGEPSAASWSAEVWPMTMVSMRLMSGPQIQSPSAGPANTTMSRTCSHIPAPAASPSPPSSAARATADAEPAQRTARGKRAWLPPSRGGRSSSRRRAAGGGGGPGRRRRWREVGAGAETGAGGRWAAASMRRCADMAAGAAGRLTRPS